MVAAPAEIPGSARNDSRRGCLAAHRVELGAIAIVLLAWCLRVYRLDVLPPGLHHDEAIEGLNALEVLSGHLRFWFPAGGGREPLFMYLAAGAVALLGPTAFALRLLAAGCATLAVAASFALGRRLFDRRVALVATALMTTSYWQVHTGRLGLRSALLAPLAALAFALLLRGVDRARPASGAAGGAALGLTAYAYFAARLLPLVALPIAAMELWRARRRGCRPAAWAVVAFGGGAALVAAPMIAYVALAPSWANERVGEASVFAQADPSAALSESVLGVLGMFFVRGDEMWKYNFDARPLFSPPLAVVFVAGLVLCLARPLRRGPAATLLWLVVMSLPSALATESPHFIRIAGLAPVLFLPPGLALVAAWDRLPPARTRLAPLALAIVVGATALATGRDYFVEWARSPQTVPAFGADMAAAAAAIRSLRPSEPVYLSVDPYEPRQLTVEFLASPALRPEQLHWFDGRRGLVLPPGPAVVVFPESARPPKGLLVQVGGATRLHADPLVEVDRIVPPTLGQTPLSVFDGQIALLRADPPPPTPSDEPMTPLLVLRLERKLDDDLTLFAQVERGDGGWGSRDDRFYLTSNRAAGETIVAPFAVTLEAGTPPGEYRLRYGVYRRDGARLRLSDGADSRTFEGVHVAASGHPWRGPEPAGSERAAQVAPGLRLRGALVEPGEARPGDAVVARAFWSREAVVADCTVGVDLRVGDQTLASAAAPLGGGWRPDAWVPDELVEQRIRLVVPVTAPGGATADVRLAGCGGAPRAIGQVRVAPVERSFQRPSPPMRLEAAFGTVARLIGYGLEGDWRPGATLRLTLYWQATGATERPLTVFTHLLDARERVRGQRDAPPLEGRRPTSGWQTGEFLIDRYDLPIAPDAPLGPYALEVGMYDPTTGARVPVADAQGRPLGDRLIVERRDLARQ